jgi:hypothetical protein
MQAGEFTINKFAILQGGLVQLRHGKIASREEAIGKMKLGQIRVRKIAIIESAFFIVAHAQGADTKINLTKSFLYDVGSFHL